MAKKSYVGKNDAIMDNYKSDKSDEDKFDGTVLYTTIKESKISEYKPKFIGESKVDDKRQLQRFLYLGTNNTYKAYKEDKAINNVPKREDAECIDRLIGKREGKEVVELIKNISLAGRAPKQIPTMFALAICARSNDADTKNAAYDALNVICRIPTNLFMFVKYCSPDKLSSGWGRSHRRGIVGWYVNKAQNPKSLGRLVTKYNKRGGLKHKDLFNLTHINPDSDGLKVVVKYIKNGLKATRNLVDKEMTANDGVKQLMAYLEGVKKSRKCTDEDEMVELIKAHGLEREHIPTQLLNSKKVWESLFENIQMTALMRNLGKMTKLGLLNDDSVLQQCIVEKMTDVRALKEARVHPFNVLLTLNGYSKGEGKKGKLTWKPNKNVQKALNIAYHKSFDAVEPTNKRYLLAIDVSDSMSEHCVGNNSISCRDAAASMMMTTKLTETNCDIVAFTANSLELISIEKTDTLDQVVTKFAELSPGPTDCAKPMIWAKEEKKKYDVFIVYTAKEISVGNVKPYSALQDYRKQDEELKDSKLIVVGMTSKSFTIADPADFGMLDIFGFDIGAAQIIAKFSCGKI